MTTPPEGRLRTTNVARDLTRIADLIEICFPDMDANGRAAVSEMRSLGGLGLLLLPVVPFDRLGIGLAMGFVWRDGRDLIGNVSLFRAEPDPLLGGGGFYIANVAVHPDHRRQGIARAMMEASLLRLREWGGLWASLQVERDNHAAIELYRSLGFTEYEVLDQWLVSGLQVTLKAAVAPGDILRLRRPGDRPQEIDLVLKRARRGAMAWTQPIGVSDFSRLSSLDGKREYLVMPDAADAGRLSAALWLVHSGWKRTQVSYFADPALTDDQRRAPLQALLSQERMLRRIIRLETTADDRPVSDLLRSAGFLKKRSLLQMRITLDQTP